VKGGESSRRAVRHQQRGLPEAEWNFVSLGNDELEVCVAYEYQREKAIQTRPPDHERSNLEHDVELARAVEKITDFDSGLSSQICRDCHESFVIPVLYPEWPDKPYLSIDSPPERKRRGRLLGERFASRDSLRATLSTMSDEDKLRFLLNKRPNDIQITLCLPKGLSREAYTSLLSGLLNFISPPRELTKPQGKRGSPTYKRDLLRQLAAFRLIERGGLKRTEVINLLKYRAQDGLERRGQVLSPPLGRMRKIVSVWQRLAERSSPIVERLSGFTK